MSSERQQFEFRMPDPGEGLTEAELDTWHVGEGEEVDEDGVLCEVETDKALVEIPIPCSGELLELRVDPGDVVQVGDVIAIFATTNPPTNQATGSADRPSDGADADSVSEPDPITDTETDAVEMAATPTDFDGRATSKTNGDERAFAAPSTRRYAREQDIDLVDVDGSGPGGRVLQDDVDAYLDQQTEPTTAEPAAEVTEAHDGSSTAMGNTRTVDTDETDSVVRRPLRGLRKTVAENMVESKQTIPHVTSGFQADARDLVALKERLDEKLDAPVTYTSLIMKAVVPALQEFSMLNASIDDAANEIVEKRYYNLGVATHTEAGLMVPVIENVDQKSIAQLGTELADLVERTRERSVDVGELQGGTFTITNTGSHSEHATFGTPIINHPEAAIMGVGRIQNQPVAVSDTEMEVRKVLPLTLSYDHRLIDGVTATQFMEYVIEAVEDSDILLSRL